MCGPKSIAIYANEGRALILLGVCFLLDVLIFYQYLLKLRDVAIYLTSWSHVSSVLVRCKLSYELWRVRHVQYRDRGCQQDREFTVDVFHASSVLLYAILVTFFVVLVVNDDIMVKRLDLFDLPHYRHLDPDGIFLTSSTEKNDRYFEENAIDGFHSLGIMVAYNNIRHVFPAAANLVITYELRTTILAVRESRIGASRLRIGIIALILPILHLIMASAFFDEGESDIYDCQPLIPGFAMLISVIFSVFIQTSLAMYEDEDDSPPNYSASVVKMQAQDTIQLVPFTQF